MRKIYESKSGDEGAGPLRVRIALDGVDLRGDETFELLPEEEAKLLAAIAEAERGETTSASHVLDQIRRL